MSAGGKSARARGGAEPVRGASAKALERKRPTRLLLEVADAAVRANVVAAGARIGLEVVLGDGGRPLRVDPHGTIAHALRVEALREVGGAFVLAPDVSRRTQRALESLSSPANTANTISSVLREDEAGRLSFVSRGRTPIDLGEAPEAEAALREARARGSSPSRADASEVPLPAGAEAKARAIVFGPSRTLSEPSSRRVLEAFGVASSAWRLAEDAARAAVHARTIGYPIDLRVASPDVSAIDAPSLSAIELRTPGEVREGYRAITREVRRVAPTARVLGVTVARHVATIPRLRVALERVEGEARMRIGLDDPIGSKLARPLTFALPLEGADAIAALSRFEGRSALPSPETPRARALVELLVRLAQIAHVLQDALVHAELAPIAPMPDEVFWVVSGARMNVKGIDVVERA